MNFKSFAQPDIMFDWAKSQNNYVESENNQY